MLRNVAGTEAILKHLDHPHDCSQVSRRVLQGLPEHPLIHRIKDLFKVYKKNGYSAVFHSKDYSTIILSVAVCSQKDLTLRTPACVSRLLSSRESFILSRMILQITLLSTKGRKMPLQFLYRVRTLVLGSLPLRGANSKQHIISFHIFFCSTPLVTTKLRLWTF